MPYAIDYHRLPTERRNPRSQNLDKLSPLQLARLMNREDSYPLRAIRRQLPSIAKAIGLISASLKKSGRLFFIGAGTSGRLGVIEAAECPPTFHTPAGLVEAIIAGGKQAVFRSKEGAEDNAAAAARTIRKRLKPKDVLVGIAASGVTPFVAGALKEAKKQKIKTILVTCNPQVVLPASVCIKLSVGPEILTGSTRLKAGTATKLVLNMLTLGAMVQLGKTYGNLMVDVRPTSKKLKARAHHLIRRLASCSEKEAADYLRQARGQTKVAVLMAARQLSRKEALNRLKRAGGFLHLALKHP